MAPTTDSKKRISLSFDADSGDCSPCVLNFQGGLPSVNYLANEDTIVHSLFNKNKKMRQLYSQGTNMTYESTQVPKKNNENQYQQFAICRYNESTGKLNIIPLDEIHQMQQKVNNYEETFDRVDTSEISFLDKEKSLAGSFGSKITKKIIHQREAEDLGTLDSNKTLGMADRVRNTKVSEGATIEEKNQDLPPFDLSAKESKDIYAIEAIIPSEVYFSLDVSDSLEFIADISTIPDELPAIVKSKLTKIASIEDKEDQEHACKILLFLYYLSLIAKNKKAKDLFQVFNDNGVPKEAKDHILKNFTSKLSKNKNTVSQFQINRVINFVAVLCLHIDSFYTKSETVDDLSAALEVPQHILQKHFTRIGCSSIRDPLRKQYTDFRLKAPLKIPEQFKFGKK